MSKQNKIPIYNTDVENCIINSSTLLYDHIEATNILVHKKMKDNMTYVSLKIYNNLKWFSHCWSGALG